MNTSEWKPKRRENQAWFAAVQRQRDWLTLMLKIKKQWIDSWIISMAGGPVEESKPIRPIEPTEPPPPTEEIDSDASNFFPRAGITDSIQQKAINDLVLALKSANIWIKMQALYPFVGGTAATHSHNLITSSYQITWTGGVVHDENGISNSLDGYGDTNLYVVTLSSLAFGVYNKSPEGTNGSDINAPSNCRIYARYAGDNTFYGQVAGIDITVAGVADARGFFILSRTALNLCKAFKNGAQYGPADNTIVSVLPSAAFQILVFNPHNLALAFISDGLSDAECASLGAAVEAYQTTLGRNN